MVEALDALEPARPLEQLALRLPVQAIYKFDDRRIVAGRIESGQPRRRRRDRHHARRQDRENQKRRELAGDAGQGPPGRRTLGRHHARPRIVHRARRRHRPCRRAPARYAAPARADLLAARQAADRRATRSWSGSARGKARATVVAIEKAVDPGELSKRRRPMRSRATMSARSTSRWRSRSPPIRPATIRAPGGW